MVNADREFSNVTAPYLQPSHKLQTVLFFLNFCHTAGILTSKTDVNANDTQSSTSLRLLDHHFIGACTPCAHCNKCLQPVFNYPFHNIDSVRVLWITSALCRRFSLLHYFQQLVLQEWLKITVKYSVIRLPDIVCRRTYILPGILSFFFLFFTA